MKLRITKYNPKYRSADGGYLPDEWTSISDIGRTYEGVYFTESQYFITENKYIDAILNFLEAYNIRNLMIESYSHPLVSKKLLKNKYGKYFISRIKNNNKICIEDIILVSRLCLRENIWCKLTGGNNTYIHFGDDFYMFIGTDHVENEFHIPSGIFKENMESPF